MFKLTTCILVIFEVSFDFKLVDCEQTNQGSTNLQTGFSFEMIMAKLQVLEDQTVFRELQVAERITILSANVNNLIRSVEQLSWVAQQTAETVNELGFNGKQIARNMSVIQRDLRDVISEQKLLLTSQQFGEYVIQRRQNSSNLFGLSSTLKSKYTSCSQIPFRMSGIYQIQPEKPFKEPLNVLCDQEYESGGWTVIQHRFDGSVNFYRGWQEYKNGFGNLEGEFWLGLDRIHQITASMPHELVVLLEDFDGNKTYAKYDRFEIGDEGQKYVLKTLGAYSGTAGDSLSDQKGMKFTTLDADNDTWDKNCAVSFTGAWWYAACHKSNLNGQYLHGYTKEPAIGMVWFAFRGHHHSLKSSKIMIKPSV